MDFGKLIGQIWAWSTAVALVLSFRFKLARTIAGLSLLAMAVAATVLTVWRVGGGHDVRLNFLVIAITGLTLVGGAFLYWGHRTAPVRSTGR